MQQLIKYKSIELIKDADYLSVEFIADDKNLSNLEDYIESLSLILEYTETYKPKYILLNKLNSDFKLPPHMFNYTRTIIFKELRKNNVKRVLMIVKEPVYESIYKDIEAIEPFMKGFKSKESAYYWIKQHESVSL